MLALTENAHRLALCHYLGVLTFAAPLVFAELQDGVALQFIGLEPVPEAASACISPLFLFPPPLLGSSDPADESRPEEHNRGSP